MQTPLPDRSAGILVVDDEDGVRGLLRALLPSWGFSVWEAAGGIEALEIYRSHRGEIDVVLLDVRMPGLDGPGTLAALREADPHVRAAFMSAETGAYAAGDLSAMGVARFFAKPFALAELSRGLRDLAACPAAGGLTLEDAARR